MQQSEFITVELIESFNVLIISYSLIFFFILLLFLIIFVYDFFYNKFFVGGE